MCVCGCVGGGGDAEFEGMGSQTWDQTDLIQHVGPHGITGHHDTSIFVTSFPFCCLLLVFQHDVLPVVTMET